MSESAERAAFEARWKAQFAHRGPAFKSIAWVMWQARAILAEGETQPAWQPIETRPMDGTRYLAVCATGLVRLVRQADPHDRLPIGDEPGSAWPDLPTHWMPLPSPPSMDGAKP